MATDDRTTREETPRATRPAAGVFAVRLWKEELAGSSEYRGTVRDVMTESFRAFRDWSGLIAFMVARIEQDESTKEET